MTLDASVYQYFSEAFGNARIHDAGIGDEGGVLDVQLSQLGSDFVDATAPEQDFPRRLEREVCRHSAFPPRGFGALMPRWGCLQPAAEDRILAADHLEKRGASCLGGSHGALESGDYLVGIVNTFTMQTHPLRDFR